MRLRSSKNIDRWLIDARVCLEKDHTGNRQKSCSCSFDSGSAAVTSMRKIAKRICMRRSMWR